jgi:hypothetical protein
MEYPIPGDVATLDGIVAAFYDIVSGAAGAPRQWERDRSLHHPKALIVMTGLREGKPYSDALTLNEFHEIEEPYSNGFYESEIHRETHQFGNIAQIRSVYETRYEKGGPVQRMGINFIQLYYDGHRWWIMSWMYDSLRPENKHQLPKNIDVSI